MASLRFRGRAARYPGALSGFRGIFGDAAQQRLPANGFREVRGAARLHALLVLLFQSVSRQRHDRYGLFVVFPLPGADLLGGAVSVEHRHLHVHQHQLEIARDKFPDRLFPVFGGFERVAG